jgi:hypothetical protein
MPTFATPELVTASVTTPGARARVAASERSDTAVLIESVNSASKPDAKAAENTKVDWRRTVDQNAKSGNKDLSPSPSSYRSAPGWC